MPIYEYVCSCGKIFSKFSHKILPETICVSCGKQVVQKISDSLFIAPEADLTFINNRIRMQDGLFYDQDWKSRKKAEENNRESASKNQKKMEHMGFTEKEEQKCNI